MSSTLVFLCLIAKISAASVETPAGNSSPLESKRAVPASREAPQLITLQKKFEELEKKQDSLMEEIRLLRETRQRTTQQKRMRRGASSGQGDMAPLPTNECTPGTNGCPISVTPFSIGDSCILCPAGPRGHQGPPGPPGRDGRDAIALITTTGNSDSGGIDVPSRPHVTPASNTSGAVYIRWGHHGCPSSSTLIYSGFAAAPSHHFAGGGANQLCLPQNPVYDEPVAGVGTSRSFLYGAEYQIDNFPARNDRLWFDVPCAVCKAPARFAKLMIPGRNICPDEDWTLEYGGYLMAERSHSAHQRSLHICVDREMQILDRTNGAPSDGFRALLDVVEGRCSTSGGGIPCGPYINGYEITCAVCTL